MKRETFSEVLDRAPEAGKPEPGFSHENDVRHSSRSDDIDDPRPGVIVFRIKDGEGGSMSVIIGDGGVRLIATGLTYDVVPKNRTNIDLSTDEAKDLGAILRLAAR